MSEESEAINWTSRPSFRPLIVAACVTGGLALALLGQTMPMIQSLIDATHQQVRWSRSVADALLFGTQVAIFLPMIFVFWRMLVNLTVRYEVKDGRFLYHHGLLVRRHDQIMLQRVRDFRVYRPLSHMIMGVGKVHIVSRDETYPELTIGPFAKPLEVEEMLHEAVTAQQGSTGFRELETY